MKINYKTVEKCSDSKRKEGLKTVSEKNNKNIGKKYTCDRKAYVFMKKYCYFPYLNVLCKLGFMAVKR